MPSRLRYKSGQRPFAILPTGEVLMMGADLGTGTFELLTCGLVTQTEAGGSGGICVPGSTHAFTTSLAAGSSKAPSSKAVPAAADKSPPPAAGEPLNAATMFERTRVARETPWSFNASSIPDACRKPSGCQIGAHPYVPPFGQRLTRGPYSKNGLPYAMGSKLSIEEFFSVGSGKFESNVRDVLKNDGKAEKDKLVVPGNLDDIYGPDAGIDCSALVTKAWRSDWWDTRKLQDGDLPQSCPTRVLFDKMQSGDAININVTTDSGHGINHVVLFAQSIELDGKNSYLQVLESSSSCDGVCWSFYSPAFFSGWAVYRRDGRTDGVKCEDSAARNIKSAPFPRAYGHWKEKVDGQP